MQLVSHRVSHMLFGINCTAPQTLPFIRILFDQGKIDFCELMVDNFIHLPPHEIKRVLPKVPLAFHIVASYFLEKPLRELEKLANHLRNWLNAFNPLYVSDHLLPIEHRKHYRNLTEEPDYSTTHHLETRLTIWQQLLERKLLIENNASLSTHGKNQAFAYSDLLQKTGAALLFDFSNAYVAEYNRILSFSAWHEMIQKTKHFHVSGFRLRKHHQKAYAIDTHDCEIDSYVLQQMKRYSLKEQAETLVIEFRVDVLSHLFEKEMMRIKNFL